MTNDVLYSIRMRASHQGRHVSGAERIAGSDSLHSIVQQLVDRALGRGASPDEIVVTIEPLDAGNICSIPSLDLTSVCCGDVATCRAAATALLVRAGVDLSAADAAVGLLDTGPSPSGGAMRGAMLMDADTGERLEPDRERGIRASHFDWSDDASRSIDHALALCGLSHFRTKEALALATKIAHGPGVLAELCWSDDPDYTAGYVASRRFGYVRLPQLKDRGNPNGGRAVFVGRRSRDIGALCRYLEKEPVLISAAGPCRTAASIDDIPFMARTARNV